MPDTDSSDVTLACADATLLSCWEEKVRQGAECSLLLKHSKGRIFTILKTSEARIPEAKAPAPASTSPAEKKKTKKRNKGSKKKRLEALLSFHQRLVDEEGMPPSKLMMEHGLAAAASVPAKKAEQKSSQQFKCDLCEYTNTTQRGVNSHKGHKHKVSPKPEALRDEQAEQSLELSRASGKREESNIITPLANSTLDAEEDNSKPFKCDVCEFTSEDEGQLNVHMKQIHKVNVCDHWVCTKRPRCIVDHPEDIQINGQSRSNRHI
jgi:hypothetical protein